MYRAAAGTSHAHEDAAAERLGRWARDRRANALIAFLGAGVAAGIAFSVFGVLSWNFSSGSLLAASAPLLSFVYGLTYVSLGIIAGFISYRSIGLPILSWRLRARARRVASDVGVDASAIEGQARAFLI